MPPTPDRPRARDHRTEPPAAPARAGRRAAAGTVVVAVLAAALLAVAAPATAAETDTFRFQPDPLIVAGEARRLFRPALGPGSTVEDSALLVNTTDQTRRFRIYGADVTHDAERDLYSVAESAATPRGVGAWITPSVDELELGPRERASITFEVARPADDEVGGFGALVAEEVVESGEGGGLDIAVRVALLVDVSMDSGAVGLSLKGVSVDVPRGLVPSTATVVGTLTNGTNDVVRVEPSATVTSLTGRSWELVHDLVELAPGESREVGFDWTTVPRLGSLVVPEVELRWSGGVLRAAGDRTPIVPLWLVACLEAVVLGAGLVELAARRRASRAVSP